MKQYQRSGKTRLLVITILVLFEALLTSFCIDTHKTADAQDPVRFRNRNRPKYQAIQDANVGDGGNVILWDDVGKSNIWWHLEQQVEANTYKIRNFNSDKYLAASGADFARFANVIQWGDISRPDTVWCSN